MKAKNISKRVLSVILCTVMLFSCWVFTAPNADAATAGNYHWKFTLKTTDNGDSNDNDSGNYVYLYGKPTNGTGKQATLGSATGKSLANSYYQVKNSVLTFEGTDANFPTSVSMSIHFDRGAWRSWGGDYNLSVYDNTTSSWKTLCSGSWGWSRKWGNTCTASCSVNSADYPVATTTSVGGGSTSVNVPTDGTSTNSSAAFSAGTVKDQYGVNWHEDATLSSNKPNGTGFSSNKITVTSGCNRDSDYTVTITATCGSASATKTCTIKTFDYIVDFVDYDGTTNLKHQTGIDYNGSATAPSSPSRGPDSTNHYAFKSWSGTYTNLTSGAQTQTVTATYTGTAHSDWTYSEISGDHSDHTKKCGSCTYSTTAAHTYGATTITIANDGKTATASRTCSTTGCNHTQETSLSIGSGITSAETTPATCTAKGKHTYTATSPYGDGKTATKVVEDIPATGHHLADNPIMYSDAEGHYYKCKDCDAFIKSDLSEGKHAHTPKAAQRENVVPATCTTAGSYNSVVRCSECDWVISSTPQTIDPLGHDYGAWTDYNNATQHQRVCANDETHIEYKNHDWSGWQHVVPTEEETGVRATVRQKLVDAQYNEETSHYNYCTVCGYTKIESHPPVEQWTIDQEHTYPATCEAAGQTTSECPDCHKTKVTPIAATGHTWVRWDGCSEEKISELSGAVPVIFKCENGCGKYCAAQYNPETKEYEEDPGHSGDSPTSYEVASNTAQIPTPSFNEHFEHFDGQMEPYRYAERKASLRVRPSEKEDDTQAMRFSGNLSASNIIGSVDFNVNPTLIIKNYTEDMPAKDAKLMSLEEIRNNRDAYDDNTVIDFGFVFTQARFIRSAKETIDYDLMTLDNIGTNYRIYRMSVVGNNLDNFRDGKTIKNWKGLTMNEDAQATFNLVIDVNKKNYQATYVARTYVIYKYHGDIICVYDQPYENYEWDNEKGEDVPKLYYSHDSVYNQAHKVLTLTEPTDFVKSYLEDKIINNTATQNFVDWNVNYTLKDFPKVEED